MASPFALDYQLCRQQYGRANKCHSCNLSTAKVLAHPVSLSKSMRVDNEGPQKRGTFCLQLIGMDIRTT